MKNYIDKTCFLCKVILTEDNKTNEHIIKNSIGGRKKVKNFICNTCNNTTGAEWDIEIDTCLGEFSALLFGIKRQKGKIASKHIDDIDTGKKYEWSPRNLRQKTPEHEFDGKNLKITAKDLKSAKQYFEKLKSEGIIPNNVKYSQEKIEEEKSDTPINVQIGFEIPGWQSNFSKSVVKSALALLSECDYEALQTCVLAKDFLDKGDDLSVIRLYYDNDPITNRPFATPLHTVYVFSEDTSIYAYVELFSIARYKILLSDNFTLNRRINKQYSINPRTAKELELKFNFDGDEDFEQLNPAYIQKSLIEEIEMQKYFGKCLQICEQTHKDKDNFIQLFKDCLLKCYENEVVNKDLEFRLTSKMGYNRLLKSFFKSLSRRE